MGKVILLTLNEQEENTSALLNTTEQISANTNANNFTGALAAKEMMADYNNKINTINSNFSDYVYPPDWGGDANNIKRNYHKFVYNMHNLPEIYGFLDVYMFDGTGFSPDMSGACEVIRQIFTEWNTGNTFVRTWQKDTWTIWKKFSFAQDDVSMNGKSTWASIFNELKQSSVYVRSVSYYVPDHPLITPPPNTREAHLASVVAGYNDWRIILDADVYNSRLYWAAFSGDEPDVWHELS